MPIENLGLYSGLGVRPCSSHRAEDCAGRNPCPPDSRTRPVFRFQTSKMTRMSKPIRQKSSSVRTSSQLLLWLKTADRQRRAAQATAHAKERPASPPRRSAALALPLPCSSTPSSATSLNLLSGDSSANSTRSSTQLRVTEPRKNAWCRAKRNQVHEASKFENPHAIPKCHHQ